MSRRVFHDRGYEVFTGWDEHTKRYFLLIERGEKILFSSFEFQNSNITISAIKAALKIQKISYPESLFEDLERDRKTNSIEKVQY